jgi:hypothetical protein
MPEDQLNNGQAAGEGVGNNAGAGEGQNKGADGKETTNENNAGGENNGAGAGEGGDNNGEKKKEGEDNAKAPEAGSQNGDDDDKDDGKEPDTRKRLSTKDFIIGRQRAKLANKGTDKTKTEGGENGKDGDGDDDDDEVAPEDEELINKVVAKNFAPILDKTISAEDDREVSEFLKENPDFKPFEAKARRYIAHPSRRHLPIETIFFEVAGKKLLKIGAERQKKADEEAQKTQTGGGSNRAGEGNKNVWDMTTEEFEAEKMRVREAGRQ